MFAYKAKADRQMDGEEEEKGVCCEVKVLILI